MPKIADLETPCVLIDAARVEANLARAQAHANANGYKLRPHIKTHKSIRFARRQIELGAVGITAQKLGEAEVMADAGIADIFVPYNIVGAGKLARLAALNARVTLSVTADSADVVAGYARTASTSKPLTVLVECDTGGRRCGVQSPADAVALARMIAGGPSLRFGGLMSYPPRGKMEEADRWLGQVKAEIERDGIAVPVVTSGNTPDMWHTGDHNVTERRPGTYIYFDRGQVSFGRRELGRLRADGTGDGRLAADAHAHRPRRRIQGPELRSFRTNRLWRLSGPAKLCADLTERGAWGHRARCGVAVASRGRAGPYRSQSRLRRLEPVRSRLSRRDRRRGGNYARRCSWTQRLTPPSIGKRGVKLTLFLRRQA